MRGTRQREHSRRSAAGAKPRIGRTSGLVIAIAVLAVLLSTASATGEPAPQSKPVNTVGPALTGTPAVGQTLTCSTGTWTNNPASYSYVWLRNGSPIAGQTGGTYVVQSADRGHSLSCQVTASNSGGEYTIGGLPSGSYHVSFYSYEGGNYASQYYNGKAAASEAAAVSVTVPNTTGGINAALTTGGQISGRVTAASNGASLANIEVCASAVNVAYNCANTNGAGEYTISSLSSGSYEVEFSAFNCSEEGCAQQNYVGQTLTGVSVSAGSTASNVNAALATGGRIIGKVTHGGSGLTGVSVCAKSESAATSCGTTSPSGEYAIEALPAGEYKLEFSQGYESQLDFLTQYYNGKASSSEAEAVAVTLGGTTTIDEEMKYEGGKISGTVTAQGGTPLSGIEVCADSAGGEIFGACASTDSKGEYVITGVASGEYRVQFSALSCGPASCTRQNYVTQYYSGKSSYAQADPVTVTAPNTVPNIDAEMLPGGQITGKVTAASGGAALANAYVCATEATNLYDECTTTGSSGEYTLSAMPSGSYTVSFSSYELGGNYLSQNTTASVTAGSTTSGVNAALPAGGEIGGRVSAASGGAGLSKIEVCADPVSGSGSGGCALTNSGGGSATAASNALAVPAQRAPAPNSSFTATKGAVFNAKKGQLQFYFKFANAGTLRWSLYFKNADVGFADSLGLSALSAESALSGGSASVEETLAEAAAKKGKPKSKKCKKGYIKHKARCVRLLVPFASGFKKLSAGAAEIIVRPNAKALKALKAGRVLHVSGSFTFQSVLGGRPVTHAEAITVRMPKRKAKQHGKKK